LWTSLAVFPSLKMTIDICRTFVTGQCKGQYCRSYSNFLYRVLVQAHVQINIVFSSEASDKSLTIIFFGLGKITTKKQKNRRKKAGQYVYISHVYIGRYHLRYHPGISLLWD
jgi:hypothetical protein